MTKLDWIIWAAGFFDGEGCITIRKDVKRCEKRKRGLYANYFLLMTINHKSREALDKLKELFGGHLISFKLKGNLYWRLTMGSENAAEMMRTLLPYLLVKRQTAETCIRFQEDLKQWYEKYTHQGYPDWVSAAREAYFQQVKVFNARNKPVEGAPNLQYLGAAPETVQ